MATESFAFTANAVSTATALFQEPGSATFSRQGFHVRINASGVTISKAPTFGGVQAALTFPISRYTAQELALALLQITS